MIWNTVIFIVTISILVTVHEFGHFIIARICGVRVECFSIGFGKKLCSFTSKRGTNFRLSAIPLGGYVKMLDGRNVELANEEKPFAFDHQSLFKRAAIVSAGPIINFLFAIVVYWLIFQIGVTTYPVKVESVIPNSPASTVNISEQAELKSIAGIKVESWLDVNSALIGQMGKDNLILTYETERGDVHQPLVNIQEWQFDVEEKSAIEAFGFIPASIDVKPIVSQIVPDSAAEHAGIKVGDRIVAYNGKPYDHWQNFVALVQQGSPIQIDIRRADRVLTLDVVPTTHIDGNGIKVGVVGIYPTNNTIIKQYDIVDAFFEGVGQTKLTISLVVRSFYQLITGVIGLKNLSGPVSIAKAAGQTASYGLVPYLYFLAFINISLGVMNLVPLPMLDGGHLIFLLLEKIKGSPLSKEMQEKCYRFGFVLLMIIMGIALFNDFLRL